MLSIERIIILLACVTFFNSCEKQSDDDKVSIYTTLIDKLPHLPPLPISIIDEPEKLKRYKDSISKIRLSIGVLGRANVSSDLSRLEIKAGSGFKSLLENFNKLENVKLDINSINKASFNNLIFFSSFDLNIYQENPQIQYFLSFSDILFNKEKDKAILELSYSSSKLSGKRILYLLVKKDNKWIIHETKLITIS